MKTTHPAKTTASIRTLMTAIAMTVGSAAIAAELPTEPTNEAAQAEQPRVVVAPYAWALNMKGTVGINGIAVPLDLQSTELLRGVKSGGMGYVQIPFGNTFVYLETLDVSFGQGNFQPFFNQTINADLFFGEAGVGWNYAFDSGLPGEGKTTVSPYLGVRTVDLKIKVNGPVLVQSIKKNWHDPAVGMIVQGPVYRHLDYVVKLDAAGFYTDGDNYRSALAMLRYGFDPAWSVAAGYRISKFKAESNSTTGLAIDMTGSGPLLGIQYSF